MELNLREASAVFTMLCYMAQNEAMTDDELALYHRFRNEGWDDLVNKDRDILKEMIEG
ncbi:hypothetical protein [Klebsiella phage IME184]|uniref:Uncharacterized protein n=1 Tax=Klebsiella phage IME184 TaxID=2860373 RepID=A0AC61NQQ5_9CAUD|nr:hypothetical protein [Klebsiella phage IME184]